MQEAQPSPFRDDPNGRRRRDKNSQPIKSKEFSAPTAQKKKPPSLVALPVMPTRHMSAPASAARAKGTRPRPKVSNWKG